MQEYPPRPPAQVRSGTGDQQAAAVPPPGSIAEGGATPAGCRKIRTCLAPVHGRVMVRGGGRGQWRGWVACWLKVRVELAKRRAWGQAVAGGARRVILTRVKLSRLAAAGGVAGPVLFTVAWAAGSLRQAGHSAAEVQLSGLAAEDARNPQIMMAGFVLLGL